VHTALQAVSPPLGCPPMPGWRYTAWVGLIGRSDVRGLWWQSALSLGNPMTRPWGGTRGSRAVYLLQDWSTRTHATGVAAVVSVCVLLTAMFTRQGDQILVWFAAVASAVVLVMVFVIAHTQARQQIALQHKLDELLRALPGTDARMIKLESVPPEVIEEIVSTEGPSGNPNSEND
jgi:low affinity Fe/Cu permease